VPRIFDSAGNISGGTDYGGADNDGIYKLTPTGGAWTESILYSFTRGHAERSSEDRAAILTAQPKHPYNRPKRVGGGILT